MSKANSVWISSATIVWLAISGYALHLGAQGVQPNAQRAAGMRDHYQQAVAMHTAVIRGDLEAAKAIARTLVDYPGPLDVPQRSSVYVTTIRRAAADAASAPHILGAAVSVAVMLNACGQCHRVAGTRPAVSLRAPSDVGGVVGHMLAHQRAADLIFQGLVVPSDSLWREGTRAMASAPLEAADLPVGALERRRLTQTEEKIHRWATDATQATDPRARANYYGQLLAGCADCHSQSTKWGPG